MDAQLLPENIIRCMKADDRNKLGILTRDEIIQHTDSKAERIMQNECENYLRLSGIEFLHLSHRAREKQGWPDLVFSCKGKFCAVELKSVTGVLSIEQAECLQKLQANGARVAVIRSVESFILFVRAENT